LRKIESRHFPTAPPRIRPALLRLALPSAIFQTARKSIRRLEPI
jgi:hypothetical protein